MNNFDNEQQLSAHAAVCCPYCFSSSIEHLSLTYQSSPYHYNYLCKTCHSRFNSNSYSHLDTSVPPVEMWLQCCFLLTSTDSLDYIAAKLHLSTEEVKLMHAELLKEFKDFRHLTMPMDYEEWHNIYAKKYSSLINQEILPRLRELYNGDTAWQPKDTAEFRRQKQRRQRLAQ